MRGIEWIKLNTNMCEDETMRLLDSLELRDLIIYVWIRLLLQAGKVNDNGLIYLKKDVPYTKEMVAILFNRPIDIIEKVLDILESFKLIEIYENNIIKICNWEKHQNIEGMKRVREGNRERAKNFRERKKKENGLLEKENSNKEDVSSNAVDNTNKINKNKNCNANVTLQKEKREKDNKNKKKNIDKEERGEEFRVNNEMCAKELQGNQEGEFKENKGDHAFKNFEECKAQSLKLVQALEKINVSIKGLTTTGLAELLATHEEKHVKMAIGKAIERNKLDINYINGILKNWLREGYPKTYEDMEPNVIKDKPNLRFINFEARQYDYKDLEEKLLGW
jgi:predicted phage replisome organizer